MYIKLDNLGYEGIAEEMVSTLLKCTDIEAFVEYKRCAVCEDGVFLGYGCFSENYLSGGVEEITIGKILEMNMLPYSIHYDELIDAVYDMCHIDITDYINRILYLDSITYNEDRHFNNIILLEKDGKYTVGPIFDNGAACLSDEVSYPMDVSIEENLSRVMAKPFQIRFEEQIRFGKRILIDTDKFVKMADKKLPESRRAFDVIMRRLEKMRGIAWEEA